MCVVTEDTRGGDFLCNILRHKHCFIYYFRSSLPVILLFFTTNDLFDTHSLCNNILVTLSSFIAGKTISKVNRTLGTFFKRRHF